MDKKIITIYTDIFCLTGPMGFGETAFKTITQAL